MASSDYLALIDANKHVVAATKIIVGIEPHTLDADSYRHVDQFGANLESLVNANLESLVTANLASLTNLFVAKFYDVGVVST